MFGDPAADPWQDAPEIELVDLPESPAAAASSFRGSPVWPQAGERGTPRPDLRRCPPGSGFPIPPSLHRTPHPGNGSSRASAVTGSSWAALSRPRLNIVADEVGADDPATKSGPSRQCGREIEGTSAEVEIDSFRHPFPIQSSDRISSPALIEAQADDVVQAVVGGSDGGEDLADVGPFLRPASDG